MERRRLLQLWKILVPLAAACMAVGFVAAWAEGRAGRRGWVEGHRAGFYERHFKRPFDICLSLLALMCLWPVMLAEAAAVWLGLGSPVLFMQQRPGLGGVPFRLVKFRTMLDTRDGQGALLPDGERLTGLGRLLRASSLDELPELVNIIRGDMSIVGPRPLLMEYLPRYDKRQARRHDVRPGLTGLAQANGRNGLSWEEKFESDVEYVGDITFLGDIKIVAKTAWAVLKREGVHSRGAATMEPFAGKLK